ncbi:hypothetical protein PAAG_11622 [Paracoccidioides lutzii Pb01]|uniref:Integrase catalytic domain-containing protein n=1 Tax=Paracoccidioides lutzii (strain ATCC MYA-826 / Pb01) TaxID=502779 RepID=A0A0A2VLA9_PARBA|nr:hypothetical protein PAAG_11622 [Paracoccidioides lutzii Pb01]KGQ01639.1 hypothetical protein PAAG_11622 [Paracoccidioides lutzii Pb01]
MTNVNFETFANLNQTTIFTSGTAKLESLDAWDNCSGIGGGRTTLRRADDSRVGFLEKRFNQFVIEHFPVEDVDHRCAEINILTEPNAEPPKQYHEWRLLMGHAGPQALEHLPERATGVKITDARRLWRYVWDYYLTDRIAETIIYALDGFFTILRRQFDTDLKKIETDNKMFTQKHAVRDYLLNKGIQKIVALPYAQALNGAEYLWPEIVRAAVHLLNLTPKRLLNWKTPNDFATSSDLAETFKRQRDGIEVTEKKPYLSHLKVYRCEVFALTTEYVKKQYHVHQLNPKAFLGYLAGYGFIVFALTTEYLKMQYRVHQLNPKAFLGYLVGYDCKAFVLTTEY